MSNHQVTNTHLSDALDDALTDVSELTTDELNLLHAVFAEEVADRVNPTWAAQTALDTVLEG